MLQLMCEYILKSDHTPPVSHMTASSMATHSEAQDMRCNCSTDEVSASSARTTLRWHLTIEQTTVQHEKTRI